MPCRAGCHHTTHDGMALHRWEASLLPCKTVVRRASCGLQRAAGIRMARSPAPLRWLSLGRWGNTQTCRARAPCYAGCGHLTRHGRALHRRKASLLPCKTVVRRPSCDLQRTAGFRVTDARAPLRWLCLGRWQKHASLPRARAVLRLLRSPPALRKGTASAGGLSVRCKTVVRRASCDLQQAFA